MSKVFSAVLAESAAFLSGEAVMNTDTNQESVVYADITDVDYKASPVSLCCAGPWALALTQESIKAAAEATASLRVSVGPKFVAAVSAVASSEECPALGMRCCSCAEMPKE